MQELRTEDPEANRWLLIPEVAPLLFQAGLDGKKKEFELAVVHLQTAVEDICSRPAQGTQVALCHRGTLDALAYWIKNGWDETEFYALTRTSPQDHFSRYVGVLHLQTAAIGATKSYRRWPDAHRPETLADAALIDRLCAFAWSRHPRYILIDNADREWSDKARMAREVLEGWRAQISKVDNVDRG
jgi:hypothetical protein